MITPRVTQLIAIAREIYASREDLQAAFSSVASPDFWYWLMWHGQMEHPEVAALIDRIPPQALRERVAGTGITEMGFYRGGLVDWRRLEESLRVTGHDYTVPGTVLDFGCGCARTLRFFGLYANTTTFHGADVDLEALEWCRRHVDFPSFTQISSEPPTPYATAMFDAVMSFSVFTHLSEQDQHEWICELARIVRPKGIVVISTHGRTALQHARDGKRELPLSKEQLLTTSDYLRTHGIAFAPYARTSSMNSKWPQFDPHDLPTYGIAFIVERYVRSTWTEYFDLIKYIEAPDDWQDIVILTRR